MVIRYMFLSLVWVFLYFGYAFAGQLGKITALSEGPGQVVIRLEGDLGPYRAYTMTNPSRFILDFSSTSKAPDIKPTMTLSGDVVNKVELKEWGDGLRVALFSSNPKRIFKYRLEEGEGRLDLICYTTSPVPQQRQRPAHEEEIVVKSPKLPSIYKGERITMDFYKTDIHNILRLFSEISGKNIIAEETVKGEVTLSLKDVPWDQALDMILEANGLTREERDGTIVVRPIDTAKGEGILVVRPLSRGTLRAFSEATKERELESKLASILYEAQNLEQEGKHSLALEKYERAYLLLKDKQGRLGKETWVLAKLAHMYLRSGVPGKAYHYSKELMTLDPNDSNAVLIAAISSAILEKDAEANLYFSMALDNRPPDKVALLNYTIFLRKQGKLKEALSICELYEKEYGLDAQISLELGTILESLGDIPGACKKYKELYFSGLLNKDNAIDLVEQKLNTTCQERGKQ